VLDLDKKDSDILLCFNNIVGGRVEIRAGMDYSTHVY